MAIRIPPQEPESGRGKRAERQLLLLIRACLSDDSWVFYDFHFVGGMAGSSRSRRSPAIPLRIHRALMCCRRAPVCSERPQIRGHETRT